MHTPPAQEEERTEVDNCALLHLSEATLLHNTRLRFLADDIYTFTGQIVTSLNPCVTLPSLYSEKAMVEARDATAQQNAAPHIFALAESAYQNMRELKRDQSVVVSGVSGAGKTEANKYIMRYLCWRTHTPVAAEPRIEGERRSSSSEETWAPLARSIMASNPVFEAFGNATTINNPNSSRFGKFIKIYFDAGGAVCSSSIATYLLEKSRLAVHQYRERNFHIFYQLLAGAEPALLASLKCDGRDAQSFHYLREPTPPAAAAAAAPSAASAKVRGSVAASSMLPGNMVEEAGGGGGEASFAERLDDAADYAATLGAMRELGLTPEVVFKLLAGVLHLGDVAFEAAPPSESGEEASQLTAEGRAALQLAQELLGIANLETTLTQRVVQAGARRLRLEFGDRPECDAEVGLERIRQEHPETNDTTDQVRKSMLAQSACVRVSCQLRAGVPLRGQLHTGSS